MARKTDPRILIMVIMTVVLLSIACFAIFQILQARPSAELDAALDPTIVPGVNGQLPEYGIPFLVDGTEVVVVLRPENEMHTQAERPFEPNQETAPEATAIPVESPTAIPPTAAPTTDPTANQPAVVNPGTGDQVTTVAYEVKQGDTLFSIAEALNTTVVLMAQYGIASDNIVPGAIINVPVINNQYCAGYRATHLVRSGDNLFRLGIQYGVTEDAIRQANGIVGNLIYAGDALCIP